MRTRIELVSTFDSLLDFVPWLVDVSLVPRLNTCVDIVAVRLEKHTCSYHWYSYGTAYDWSMPAALLTTYWYWSEIEGNPTELNLGEKVTITHQCHWKATTQKNTKINPMLDKTVEKRHAEESHCRMLSMMTSSTQVNPTENANHKRIIDWNETMFTFTNGDSWIRTIAFTIIIVDNRTFI
jgi:hypothetical protein